MGEKERSFIYGLLGTKKGKVAFDLGRIVDGSVLGVDRMLAHGEIPHAAVFGKFENGKFGLLVATDFRLIALDSETGLLTRSVRENVIEIPYDMIKSINYKLGYVFGEITIKSFPDGSLSVEKLNKRVVPTFAGWVRNRIGVRGGDSKMGRGEATTVASLGRAPTQSFADELTKLAALRDSSVLSEAEFLETKKRLLSR